MKRIAMIAVAALTFAALPLTVRADETAGEKVDSTARHATAGAKKEGRALQDKVCAKSDASCAAQKAKHGVQNTGDSLSNTAKDTKNKVD